ncbi:NAD-P-binding protein [Gloeopeniophorella convolvens]|nr:NAD-P-binding protein [Gloeopeniophorella convolvens]
MDQLTGIDEDLQVTNHHDVYPAIDPQTHYAAQTYSGKVVLVTGASRGIGLEIAIQYARAGAALSLVARKQETLDISRDAVRGAAPDTQILLLPADVRDVRRAEEVVAATVAQFGRLDVLVANAGAARPMTAPFASKDPSTWWDVLETNIRGVYNYVHFSLPELAKTKGSAVIITSVAAQARLRFASEYCTSKHAIGRFAEFAASENPDVKVFALHPGVIKTELGDYAQHGVPTEDALALPAATALHLTAGKADFLSGRYVSARWDLTEVERDWKEKIVGQNLLVSKLAVPLSQGSRESEQSDVVKAKY